jgi:hypothetical protein
MAPTIFLGFATPAGEDVELLRWQNINLEREATALHAELDAVWRHAERAEVRLCAQLGEAEVEAIEVARACQEFANGSKIIVEHLDSASALDV